MVNQAFQLLGMRAKDKITNFEGIITSISFDLHGCIQAILSPVVKDGVIPESHWFDMKQLEITDTKHILDSIPKFEKTI